MTLTIGQLAEAGAVNAETIRYYERMELLRAPERTAGGYRQYGPSELRRLRFIRRAKALGFSLAEIRELLALRVHDPRSCGAVSRRVDVKIQGVEQRMREMRSMLRTLKRLRASCATGTPTVECPILEALDEDA
ncbi:MAG: heavy metal-responsive transcriptional regulator [Gemmatimonadota bacterium]|nr:heavy metal-responsive transcriptional regulator [Gemmatimonadota bacterium]MDE3151063.1 heavy metal-responsive transcriptional regulator [Gemmatimonadota bacterium]